MGSKRTTQLLCFRLEFEIPINMTTLVCHGVVSYAITQIYGLVGKAAHTWEFVSLDGNVCTISLPSTSVVAVAAALAAIGQYDGVNCRFLCTHKIPKAALAVATPATTGAPPTKRSRGVEALLLLAKDTPPMVLTDDDDEET